MLNRWSPTLRRDIPVWRIGGDIRDAEKRDDLRGVDGRFGMRAHRRAWKTPGREIALARLARAQELGMSYREYTAIILDRGVHL